MPSQPRTYAYEAMFLISQSAAADLGSAVQHVTEILARGHAEVLAMRKWDERRLAYEIRKQKRGLYILAYFKAPGDSLAHIERDCNLSESVIRSMILRADHLTEDEMRAADGRDALRTEAMMRARQTHEPVDGAAAPTPGPTSAQSPAPAGAVPEPATAAAESRPPA